MQSCAVWVRAAMVSRAELSMVVLMAVSGGGEICVMGEIPANQRKDGSFGADLNGAGNRGRSLERRGRGGSSSLSVRSFNSDRRRSAREVRHSWLAPV